MRGQDNAKFAFFWSNGWWEVQIHYLNPPARTPKVESCMRIPDGVRTYMLFEAEQRPNVLTPGRAYGDRSPPLDRRLLAAIWLAVCPNPELPVLEEGWMRRFIVVPSSSGGLRHHPKNRGAYTRSDLPGGAFLSELSVSNNGVVLDLGANFEDEIRELTGVYTNGFLETRYKVGQTTNVNGIMFPLRSTLTFFSPSGVTNGEIHVSPGHTIEVKVDRISFAPGAMAVRQLPPAKLLAFDSRPVGVPHHQSVSYLVTNDQWLPITHTDIVRRVRAVIPRDPAPR